MSPEPRERLAVVERARVEAHAEHRGVAHERAVARVEPVDPRGGGGLQRLGQRVVAGRGGGEQVAEELGVAGGAVRRAREHRRRQRRVLGQVVRQRERRLGCERRERERGPARPGRRRGVPGRVAAGQQDQPRVGGQRVEHGAEQRGRRGVHVVGVLDHQHRGVGQRRGEEPDDGVVQPVRAERGRECGDGRGVGQFGAERGGEQREPRLEVVRPLGDGGAQARDDGRLRVVPVGADQRQQELAPGAVGAGAAVRLAGREQDGQPRGLGAHRLDELRLADARRAGELGVAALAAADLRERAAQQLELAVAPHERRALLPLPAALAAAGRADGPRLDGARLALERERRDVGELEPQRRAVEHAGRGVDPAGRRLRREPRGEVGDVAHRRVRLAVVRPDVPGEGAAAVDAELERERAAAVGDRAQREQHPLLLVADRARSPRHEHELPAVGLAVGAEQGDLVRLAGELGDGQQRVERGAGLVGRALDERIDAGVADERDGDEPVLGRAAAAQHVTAHRDRDPVRDRRPRRQRRLGGREVRPARRGLEQQARPARRADHPRRERRGERRGEDDLARRRGLLHPQRRGDGGAGDDRLAVRAAGQAERERAAVHAHRHPQRGPRARRDDRARGAQRAAHPDGRAQRALGVRVALEEQQQRVAAELQQAAAVRVGDREQRGERGLDRLADPLRALRAEPGEPLGQLREAADVGEDQRARQHRDVRSGRLGQCPERDPRHVRLKRARGIRSARHDHGGRLRQDGPDPPGSAGRSGAAFSTRSPSAVSATEFS